MKRFENGLSEKISIYVPSTMHDIPLSEQEVSEYVMQTSAFLADMFGGATMQNALGAWKSENGNIIAENIMIVYSYAHELLDDQLDAVYNYTHDLCIRMNQEAVSVEINGKLYFID